MPTLVLAEGHNLMPLAAKLRAEGHPVSWAPRDDRYRRAWEGAFPAAPIDAEVEEGTRLLTDVSVEGFGTRFPTCEPSPLRVCGWWDGEYLHAPHLFLVDLGGWVDGFWKPLVPGGATLVPGYEKLVWEAFSPTLDELKSSWHKGLVSGHLDKSLSWTGWSAGWESLHLHAWLASCETGLGETLDGAEPKLRRGHTVVIPVTIANAERPIAVDPDVMKRTFWHDVRVDGSLQTAGTDGFVAVVHGEAQSLALARRRALEAAGKLELAGKQLRLDVGAQVEVALAGLEMAGWTV